MFFKVALMSTIVIHNGEKLLVVLQFILIAHNKTCEASEINYSRAGIFRMKSDLGWFLVKQVISTLLSLDSLSY